LRFKFSISHRFEDILIPINARIARFAKYKALETTEGSKRACWNDWIAPHNVEGFFLNMGDILVKAGDWQAPRKIYANAKISSTYAEWKYREILEERIQPAETNVAAFNAPPGSAKAIIMVNSAFSCMASHRQ
jgi:hypothetical protein